MANHDGSLTDNSISDEDDTEHSRNNGLTIAGPPWGLENVSDCEVGGHHPVHLTDILHLRYKVIHKLGSGGYANVWLCRDIALAAQKYGVVKIIMGEGSTATCPESRVNTLVEAGCEQDQASVFLSLPLDHFVIVGPNGSHYAFVYPVLGPRVSRLLQIAALDDPGPSLRKVCREATQAMALLHRHSICHGDFRPANILGRICGFDGLTEVEVLKILGPPQTTDVTTMSGEVNTSESAPKYLVYPVDWDEIQLKPIVANLEVGSACLIDFGESFQTHSPPPEIGIPQVYCPSENALEQKVGEGCDIWALGCTLFEIRTGRKLFDTFDDDVDEYLCKLAMILGKLPEPWWSKTWESRDEFFDDETDAAGRVVEVHQQSQHKSPYDAQPPDGERNGGVVFERAEPRSLEEAISLGLIYESNTGPNGLKKQISREETEIFADLLSRILKYNPAERLTAKEVLEHRWFQMYISIVT